jgi:Histidine kinase-, DNA gyrase B-, and HSP90-like ATPase
MGPTMADKEQSSSTKLIHTDPTKDFFVNMITRDISLADCIFDLLDNSIDGARRRIDPSAERPFLGSKIWISLDRSHFSIKDNCGGITLSDAIDYAFHFGRRLDAPDDIRGGIGLYGIGMKRAIFKIGRTTDVLSHAADASYKVHVDVIRWMRRSDWDFEYDDMTRSPDRGTEIKIVNLNAGVGDTFADTAFSNNLIKNISRDYTFFIEKGLEIEVSGFRVPSNDYRLKESADVAPALDLYEDDGVSARIVAGLIDDLADDIPEDVRLEKVERFGWYIVCNDRVVLAGDKSTRTVWGNDGFPGWHPQYNGFAGFVFFNADDQRKLPWTTTKRELDASSPLYRRAIARMKPITQDFISYSNRRKTDLELAKSLERAQNKVDVYALTQKNQPLGQRELRLPKFGVAVTGPVMITIAYKKSKIEIDEIKKNEGLPTMSAKDVGIRTFNYYRKAELGK